MFCDRTVRFRICNPVWESNNSCPCLKGQYHEMVFLTISIASRIESKDFIFFCVTLAAFSVFGKTAKNFNLL
jgi:hypothetical protein